ncbi:MAG: hypothetical protein AAGC60_25640 [Acidobacteriota bacterium]
MADDWTPRPNPTLDLLALDLDREEGFVLSRLDGATSVRDLRALTGLPAGRVATILERLAAHGVIDGSGSGEGERADEPAIDPAAPVSTSRVESGAATGARSWRRIFEQELHPLPVDLRVERAADAQNEILRALCFDPAHRVIAALLENPRCGLEHARLVAAHHRSSRGLDALGEQAALVRDPQVERHLFRNPQTSIRLLRRIFGRSRMAKVYRLAVGHDASEVVRETARRTFRKKFTAGTAEERVKLILDCEARCLALLVGIALDAKAVALLCRRALPSMLLVRNLARWPSTPPPVLAHLLRQPHVRRNQALRTAVLRHPNATSAMKQEI